MNGTHVVLDLPEPDLLVIVPDDITDDDIKRHCEGNDHGQGEAKVDVKEILEELCIRRDDTKIQEESESDEVPRVYRCLNNAKL